MNNVFAQLTATSVRFKRTAAGEAEYGVALGFNPDEPRIIIDRNGEPVKGNLWTYTMLPWEGNLKFNVQTDAERDITIASQVQYQRSMQRRRDLA